MSKTWVKNIVKIVTVVTIMVIGGFTLGTISAPTQVTNTKDLKTTDLKSNIEDLTKSSYKLSPLKPNNRLVYIYGPIDGDSAAPIVQQILKLGSSTEPMYIFIDSPGGSVIAGSFIISAIEAASGPVNTVCVQFCASMAAMIHQYGTNRLVMNKSVLMFHPASGGVNPGEVDKTASELNFFKRFIGKMEENAAARAKLTYKEYKYLSGTELWLDSEDALSQKFADKIVYVNGSDVQKLVPNLEDPKQKQNRRHIFQTNKFDIMW